MTDTSTASRRHFLSRGGAALLGAAAAGALNACGGASAGENPIWIAPVNPPVVQPLPDGGLVSGHVAPAYQPVLDAFVANFRDRREIGASLAVTVKGVPVVDLWGGHSDTLAVRPSVPWARDDVSLVFSCTKGATALCAHMLVAQGQLDLDKWVAYYWPEFAEKGKDVITVRMLLQHAAGLAAIPFSTPVRPGGWADPDYMSGLLAATTPWWEPGTAHGYHGMTFGWLVGELVKRVSGLSLGTFFARHVAAPLGIDFWIGTPEAVLPRVAPMMAATEVLPVDPVAQAIARDPASMQAAMFFNVGGWLGLPPDTPPAYNTKASLQAEIPAAGGVTNARGLATMYAALANGGALNGVRLLPEDYTAQLGMIQSAAPIERMALLASRFGLGFHGGMDNRARAPGNSAILGPQAFGHAGFGGSLGFADPQAQMSFGYQMTRMGPGTLLNDRGQSLVDAVYGVLGRTSNRYGFWV
ncbi:MAG: serine hydrolase domain-containing protein [Pseudomonadota bacterium]